MSNNENMDREINDILKNENSKLQRESAKEIALLIANVYNTLREQGIDRRIAASLTSSFITTVMLGGGQG